MEVPRNEKVGVNCAPSCIRITGMQRSGIPHQPRPHFRLNGKWIAFIIVDLLITAALVYFFVFNEKTEPDFAAPTTQQVRGELIDDGELPVLPSIYREDPLMAKIDQLLEETAYLEEGNVESDRRATVNDPEHAKYASITFDDIADWKASSRRAVPDGPIDIPAEVKKFDEEWVSVPGFMQPLRFDGKRVSHFMLMRDQALCCFGKPIGLTDWIDVPVREHPVDTMMHFPVIVLGKLHIGETKANGETVSLFRMQCDKVLPPGVMP